MRRVLSQPHRSRYDTGMKIALTQMGMTRSIEDNLKTSLAMIADAADSHADGDSRLKAQGCMPAAEVCGSADADVRPRVAAADCADYGYRVRFHGLWR